MESRGGPAHRDPPEAGRRGDGFWGPRPASSGRAASTQGPPSVSAPPGSALLGPADTSRLSSSRGPGEGRPASPGSEWKRQRLQAAAADVVGEVESLAVESVQIVAGHREVLPRLMPLQPRAWARRASSVVAAATAAAAVKLDLLPPPPLPPRPLQHHGSLPFRWNVCCPPREFTRGDA